MPDDDPGPGRKRVTDDHRRKTVLFVAGAAGLTSVSVAGDRVGRFDLRLGEPVRDVAGRGDRLLVATDEDVLVGAATGDDSGFEPTGFGPATAVAVADERSLAVGPDGRVAALVGDEWSHVGTVAGPRRMDGDLLATAGGTYRVADGLARLGPAASDVAAAGGYAARTDGLYRLADTDRDAERLRDGAHTTVTAADGRAHAVVDGGLVERERTEEGERWLPRSLPVEAAVADVAYAASGSVYAVTTDGTVLVDADPAASDGRAGWRSRALGVEGVCAATAP